MAIEFTLAQEVAAGDLVKSSQLVSLANAFNDRICSGLGDPTERIFFYIWSIFNQIRNSNAGGNLFGSKSEYFESYQMLSPDLGNWPLSSPGSPEGANVETPINAFIFGNEAVDLDNEPVRLALKGLAGSSLSTPASIWYAAKTQRGVINVDAELGEASLYAPAMQNGWEYYKIAHNPWSPHGNSYGGFVPSPEDLGSMSYCVETGDPLYHYFFTKIADGSLVHYCGPCSGDASNWENPSTGTLMVSIHVTPYAYHILKQNGTYDILPINEWVEGPYESCGKLQKKSSGMLTRVLHAWMSEFRGSDIQFLANTSEHLQHAFDFERYLSNQNQLAPNKGTIIDGVPVYDYPLFSLTGSSHHAAGTKLNYDGGGTSHQYSSFFSLGAARVLASKLTASCEVVFLNGTEELKRITVVPDSNGDYSNIIIFDNNTSPNVSIKIINDLDFVNNTGYLSIECSEILTNKPSLLDAYVLLRLGSAGIVSGTGIEGIGTDVSTARTIGEDYFQYGCIINRQNEPGLQKVGTYVNTNAVYDAARRFSQYARCLNRTSIAKYKVESGISTLWFNRYKTVDGVQVDMFDGLLPVSGTGNGIVTVAPVNGWTNEWVMHVHLKPYSSSDASPWKVDNYSDWNPFINRALIKSTIVEAGGSGDSKAMQRHYIYGQNEAMIVEAVSGYTYALGCNPNADEKFFKSCQVYKKPYYITDLRLDGDLVKVTLNTRLQHHDNAPATISDDTGTWDIIHLYNQADPPTNNEDYRTDENGIRQYLLYPGRHADVKIGDLAHDHNDTGEGSSFRGAIIPHFYFTKLVPKPYIDSNDEQDSTDTRVTSDVMRQCELYLRSMCEGYVDDVIAENDDPTKGACACAGIPGGSVMYDWSYENLCYSSFGGRWVTMLPESLRSDKPSGFGPMPNTGFYADVYNQIVKAVNKLVAVRVPLPMTLKTRYRYFRESKTISSFTEYSPTLEQYIWSETINNPTTPANATLYPELATTDWTDYGAAQINSILWYTPTISPGGTYLSLEVIKRVTDYKFEPINPEAEHACNPDWYDMLASNMGWVGKYYVYTNTGTVTRNLPVADSNYINPPTYSHYCAQDNIVPIEKCKVTGSGKFDINDYGVFSSAYQFFYGKTNKGYDDALISNLIVDGTYLAGRRIFIHGTSFPMDAEGAYLVIPTV